MSGAYPIGASERTCGQLTRRGTPCAMRPLAGSSFCFSHDPQAARARAIARKRGGRHRQAAERHRARTAVEPVCLDTVRDVHLLLARTVADVLAERRSLRRARELGYLIGQALRLVEASSFEERIAALEKQLAGRGALDRPPLGSDT